MAWRLPPSLTTLYSIVSVCIQLLRQIIIVFPFSPFGWKSLFLGQHPVRPSFSNLIEMESFTHIRFVYTWRIKKCGRWWNKLEQMKGLLLGHTAFAVVACIATTNREYYFLVYHYYTHPKCPTPCCLISLLEPRNHLWFCCDFLDFEFVSECLVCPIADTVGIHSPMYTIPPINIATVQHRA